MRKIIRTIRNKKTPTRIIQSIPYELEFKNLKLVTTN